jgi:hypothetical protein
MSSIVLPSSELMPVARALESLLEGIGLKAYPIPPKGLDRLPAGVVEWPSITRTGIDEAEPELGTNEWLLEFPVNLYIKLDKAERAGEEATDLVEAWIVAVDGDQGLSGEAYEAKVVSAEPAVVEDRSVPMLVYETRVQVSRLVSPSP